MEDLRCGMGIQRWRDRGQYAQIAVNELTQPHVVFDGTHARSTTHEKLKVRNAKGILSVNDEQTNTSFILSLRVAIRVELPN